MAQPTQINLDGFPADSDVLAFKGVVQSTGVTMQCPVRIGLKRDGSDLWLLPLEPLVSVRGGKTIVQRNIAKAKGVGTVKEQFSQNDYEINVVGLLQSSDGTFPEQDLATLQKFLTAGQSIIFESKLTSILGISLVCITTMEYVATQGLENQAYSFNGLSDQDFDLS